jgi:hypothetical protein
MRYFLNVRTHDAVLVDEEGEEFPDIYQVCKYAVQLASDLARKYPRRSQGQAAALPLTLEVMDDAGMLVFRAPIH